MSFHRKVTVLFLFLVLATPVGLLWMRRHYYRAKPAPIPPRPEVTITILPGWNLRNVAEYLVAQGFASTTNDVYDITGKPASLPIGSLENRMNFEGYIAPETYRVFRDAEISDVVRKLEDQRTHELRELEIISATSTRASTASAWEILTKASLLEEEARTLEDKKIVADILDRRLEKGWRLQLDSTVHYAVGKTGTVFTTEQDRAVNSPWNTYRFPGLPPTPICNPSVESIEAALNPTPNRYWFFLTGNDGTMHYAKTLEEHTANRYKYLR
jgi:UPF0755 protein